MDFNVVVVGLGFCCLSSKDRRKGLLFSKSLHDGLWELDLPTTAYHPLVYTVRSL